MPKAKIAITLDGRLLRELDRAVKEGRFGSRSEAIESAVRKSLDQRAQLARELAKVDPAEERALAEEGMAADFHLWPEY